MAKSKNHLDAAQQFKVCTWLNDNWEKIVSERLSAESVSFKVTKELNMTVTEANVFNCCKAIGKTWPSNVKKLDTSAAIKTICQQIAKIAEVNKVALSDEFKNLIGG